VDGFEQAFPEGPPADPEEWSDDQWLAWLKATDPVEHSGEHSVPVTAVGRLTHSAGGHVLGQAMLGMAHALYGRRDDEVVVVAEAGSEPGDDEPFTVRLDPDHPERSSVVFKPVDPPPV
jgi:hypothetical protein